MRMTGIKSSLEIFPFVINHLIPKKHCERDNLSVRGVKLPSSHFRESFLDDASLFPWNVSVPPLTSIFSEFSYSMDQYNPFLLAYKHAVIEKGKFKFSQNTFSLGGIVFAFKGIQNGKFVASTLLNPFFYFASAGVSVGWRACLCPCRTVIPCSVPLGSLQPVGTTSGSLAVWSPVRFGQWEVLAETAGSTEGSGYFLWLVPQLLPGGPAYNNSSLSRIW